MSKTVSKSQTKFTRVQMENATTNSFAPVKIIDSWDSAIAKAKQKIARLKEDIETFKEMKDSGEPWPGAQ